jgi:uncharacterized protein
LSFKIKFFDTKTATEYHARLMTQQPVIDSGEFARKAQYLEGEFAVRDLTRLHDQLASSEGTVHYALQGGLTVRREQQIECTITGLVQLVCQRCLGSMAHRIDVHSRLMLVPDESRLPALDEEDDSSDYMVAEAALDVKALIEDEVLLALPIAPRHEGECIQRAGEAGEGSDRKSPFAALAQLKRPQQK